MKNLKETPLAKSSWLTVGLIVAVLAVLFWRSFSPDYVFFSNDGPLGVQNAAWQRMPAGLTGMWDDLNYLGADGGAGTPSITGMSHFLMSPLLNAKFYTPVALLILGVGAWSLFRQLKLSPLATTLGALAAMLNSTFFSSACWGVAAQENAAGMDYFAAALVVGCQASMPALVRWSRFMLAGLCVGMNVMEAADIGALYAVMFALFVLFHALTASEGSLPTRTVRGISRIAIVAVFAFFIAFQAVQGLLGQFGYTTQQGSSSTPKDSGSNGASWDWATQWSLPKAETAGLLVPGLFGYKMNTPEYMSWFRDAYRSGVYWGGMGRDPNIDRYFDAGSQGQQPNGYMRFTGGGNYCGILVLLIAAWAMAQAFRKQNSLFPNHQKRMVQFWAVVMLLCLLLSWGRFAPFYSAFYQIPYVASIRNPAKFLNFFSWALAVVFAYGVDALNRRYLDATAMKGAGIGDQLKNWWAKATSFDRKWTYAILASLGASVIGWCLYSAQKPALIAYLAKVGFGGGDPAQENSGAAIANFSIGQLGWFVVLFAVGVGLILLVLSGYFSGPRVKLGIILLGGFLLFDMGRANLPWLVDWDYKQKYEVGSLDPIVDFLKTKAYEHRVAGLPFEPQRQLRGYDYLFGGSGLYRIEWMQHHFPFYNVQSLDVVQMPRMPEDMKAFKEALQPRDPSTYPLLAREWILTNTRYLLGAADFLPILNQELDPVQQRFRIAQRFDVVPKPGITHPANLEELTAVTSDDGDLALFEFTAALPRAKIYSNWLVNTNDQANLKLLADLNFDPAKTVLVSTPETGLPAMSTNDNSGTVDYQFYDTKHIVLSADTTAPSVLLLNDKYDSQWNVTVDGKPVELLRCNFMMRGVYLPTAGKHTLDFRFHLPLRSLYVTLTAIFFGLVLCAFLAIASRNRQTVVS